MSPTPDCERVRTQLMAALDGATSARSPRDQEHLAACASCQQWLGDLESVVGQLQGLSYRRLDVDLWSAVEGRIRPTGRDGSVANRIWPIAGLVLAWRALQLSIDLPLPELHPMVPLAAAIWVIARVTGDPLAIETHAPELQKEGV